MASINILDFEVANRIAAGEVVDRPASVLKELLENAIDAGATEITAEIRGGGIAMIRVADNGCGMEAEDLPLALKRHATSKIRTSEDLDGIATLGFRGEALAAISSVSRITLISKTKAAQSGTLLTAENGTVTEVSEVGCPDGTTVTVEALFEAVPARRKFLKKDATEASACVAFVEKVAMSRPDISFRMISDGTLKFQTAGDGKVQDMLYAVLGRDIATRLIGVSGDVEGIRVRGFVGRSDNVKNSRTYQSFFLNGRYVKSGTVTAALERAFTSFIAPGKFPVAALYLSMDHASVDVNVHPAKLEVKFSDEHSVFEAVYHTVREALEEGGYRPEMSAPAQKAPSQVGAHASVQTTLELYRLASESARSTPVSPSSVSDESLLPKKPSPWHSAIASEHKSPSPIAPLRTETALRYDELPKRAPIEKALSEKVPSPVSSTAPDASNIPLRHADATITAEGEGERIPEWRIVGIAFDTYILVEMPENYLLVIDQHAAHERILFEELKKKRDMRTVGQALIIPLNLSLSEEERAAAVEFRSQMQEVGFEYALNEKGVLLSTLPDTVSVKSAEELFVSLLGSLLRDGIDPAVTEAMRSEKLLYQVACKAAIKGGRNYGIEHMKALVEKLLTHDDITVCPHGRPVAFRLTRKELEHWFERA